MKKCPACRREWADQTLFCPLDGNALTLGVLLGNKYQLEEKIGEGGMGVVYRATHVRLDSPVAIKILHPRLIPNDTAVERFLREARVTAKVNHDNAVKVFDCDTMDGIVYFVLEYLEGVTLGERMRQRSLTYAEINHIFQQICAALEKAHAKGILHRDLKPDNIFLIPDEDGPERVKVLDFGIAKLLTSGTHSLTADGTIVGTPQYMSPEQGLDEELDARSDVYSLGVFLYQMLTGQVPFQGSTPVAVLLKHVHEIPKPPRELRADIPSAVEAVVLRALAKKRTERQQSARQLAEEFRAALEHLSQTRQLESSTLVQARPASGEIPPLPSAPLPPVSVTPTQEALPGHAPPHLSTTQPALMSLVDTPAKATTELEPGNHIGAAETPNPTPIRAALSTVPTTPRETSQIKETGWGKILTVAVGSLLVLGGGGYGVFALFQSGSTPPQTVPPVAEVKTLPPVPNKPPLVPPPGMVYLTGGTFLMGNNQSDDKSEKPEHSVTVGPFFLDRTEVTNAEYAKFVTATRRRPPEGWEKGIFPSAKADFPVSNVDWNDATAFAKWAGKRLPTEAEWEYAARGGENRLYPWGNENDESKWKKLNSDTGKAGLFPVGSYPNGASKDGALDLAGNVSEWTASEYKLYPGSQAKPRPGQKIVRGGNFSATNFVFAMTTTRNVEPPQTRNPTIGFRCAKDVSP